VSVRVISATAVASFDVTVCDSEVSDARDGSALVTSSLTGSLLFTLASSTLATRGELSAGVVVGVVIVAVPDAVGSTNKTVWDIVEASFDAIHPFVFPKRGSSLVVLSIVTSVVLPRRPGLVATMALGVVIVAMSVIGDVVDPFMRISDFALVTLVGVLVVGYALLNYTLVMLVVAAFLVCTAMGVVGGAAISATVFLSPTFVVTLITQRNARGDVAPKGDGWVGLPAFSPSGP
jgi:hypothetical protein